MHLCLVILLSTTVHGISRISQPGMKAVNFAEAIPGRKLNGNVIKEIEVKSEGCCRFECVEDERCQSYNFGMTKNNAERFKCQLSNSDRFTGFINFTKDDNFSYGGIQVIKLKNSFRCTHTYLFMNIFYDFYPNVFLLFLASLKVM